MIRLLFGAFLAASLDFAVGVFTVIFVSQIWQKPLTLPVLCFGMLLAVLPDFDLALEILKKKKSTGEHKKSLFHTPLFFLPLICLPLWLISGYLATIALVGLLWHYWHDLTEEGPGLAFEPFSRKRFLLQLKMVPKWIANEEITALGCIEPIHLKGDDGHFHESKKSLKISWTIKPEQLEKFYAETAKEWLEREYLALKVKPIVGLGTLFIALTIFAVKYF